MRLAGSSSCRDHNHCWAEWGTLLVNLRFLLIQKIETDVLAL